MARARVRAGRTYRADVVTPRTTELDRMVTPPFRLFGEVSATASPAKILASGRPRFPAEILLSGLRTRDGHDGAILNAKPRKTERERLGTCRDGWTHGGCGLAKPEKEVRG